MVGVADLEAACARRVHACVFLVPVNNTAAALVTEPTLNVFGVAGPHRIRRRLSETTTASNVCEW
jgi:hypothetical protein